MTHFNQSLLKRYLDFAWAMTEKEIKARYKRAIFGFLWIILNPLLQMLIIGTIFSFFIDIPNYFLFLFAGLLPWQFFSLSLNKATPSLVYERALLQKARFPKEIIPLSIVFSNFFHFVISLTLLLLYLLFTGNLYFPHILVLIPALFWLLTLTSGIVLITASLQVRYRDINFFIQTALILWFYASPIIYSLHSIPAQLLPLFQLNPLTAPLELIHYATINQGILNPTLIGINASITLALIVTGFIVYTSQHKYFVDWL